MGVVASILPDLDVLAFGLGIPVRMIQVSPIGRAFFSEYGLRVLLSELVWVWLPCALVAALAYAARAIISAREGRGRRE